MPFVEWLAQRANHAALSSRRPVRRCGRLLRNALLRTGDPLVTVEIEGSTIQAPLSHELPHYRRAHTLYSVNVATIAQLVSETDEHPTMIDVGANVGDTVALVKSRVPGLPILCIEGDAGYAGVLKLNVARWPEVEVRAPCLLAERSGVLAGDLSRSGGSAMFTVGDGGNVATATLDDVVADYPHFAMPSLIKSDTDGFEGRVIAGSLRTIDRAHPVLFFEYDPTLLRRSGTEGLDLLLMLRQHRYSIAVVYDNFGNMLDTVDLQSPSGIEAVERMAAEPSVFYLDVAAFPIGRERDAAELCRREQRNTADARPSD
jgi:FkbM family methyltransferase